MGAEAYSEDGRVVLVLLLAEIARLKGEVQRLREAGDALVSVIDAAGLMNLSHGVQLGPTVWYVKASDAVEQMRAALSEMADDDWIIKGVKGEVYPCKPDIFAATYEAADRAPTPPAAPYKPLTQAGVDEIDKLLGFDKEPPPAPPAAGDEEQARAIAEAVAEHANFFCTHCDAWADQCMCPMLKPPRANVRDRAMGHINTAIASALRAAREAGRAEGLEEARKEQEPSK